jgi:hypothetical protein
MEESNIEVHIQYLSQGTVETGGYRHEFKLAGLLAEGFKHDGRKASFSHQRLKGHFHQLGGYIHLLFWFYKHATAQVNIVPLRGGLPSMLRNIFTQNKTIVVLHSHVQPYASWYLKLLYYLLLKVFSVFKPKHAVIVTVANCWKTEFEKAGVPAASVYVVPNLFIASEYASFQSSTKQKLIHLGMNESKTDKALFDLAERLNKQGYRCYFSTTDKAKETKGQGYEVVYFSHFENYLKVMSESLYTIQFPSIEEGWSRIGHESILVGTQLIGRPVGGLAELLEESGSIKANSINEIEAIITKGVVQAVHSDFLKKYDELKAAQWIVPLVNFCKA